MSAGDETRSLMSMHEAAKWLGLEGKDPARWLRRHLQAREKHLGRALLVRVGKNPMRPRYRIAAATLRKHVPELIDPQPEVMRALKAVLTEMKRERRQMADILEDIQFQQAAILASLGRLAQRR